VGQIKTAMQEIERGNSLAFATGKAARQQEKILAKEFKCVGGLLGGFLRGFAGGLGL